MNRRTLLAAVPATLALAMLGTTALAVDKDDELFPGITKALKELAKDQRRAAN